jgi:hypothetical protein
MSDQPLRSPPAAGYPTRAALRRIALFDVILPLAAVVALQHSDAEPLVAYAAAGFFPALSIVVSWISRRSIDVVGVGVLIGIASSLIVALFTSDPRFALVRAAPAFGLFGIACLVSLPTARPLMFFVARSFAAAGDRERIASWNERLEAPAFRQTTRRLTAVWGLGALAQAAFGVAVAFLAPAGVAVAVVMEPAMAIAIIAALLAWSRTLQRSNSNRTSSPGT